MSIRNRSVAVTNLDNAETVNVTKLVRVSDAKVQFQRRGATSRQVSQRNRETFTASASPNVYFVSLSEPCEIVLSLTANKK